MNFIAIIGVTGKIETIKSQDYCAVTVKVEKPFVESNEEDWYDIVKIKIDKQLFKNELNLMSTGSIIGVKGRIKNESNNMQLVAERVQVF